MEKDSPCKWKPKESWDSATYTRQINFKKECIKRQRTVLYNDKGINPPRGYNICKYYAPNIGAPKCIKQIVTDIKGETDSNSVIGGSYNIPLTSMDRSSREENQ